MPNFKYRARDKLGKPIQGSIFSQSKETVAKLLEDIGYIPIAIAEAKDFDFFSFGGRFDKVHASDLNMFTRQLLALQRAGLPLLVSLGAIEKQVRNRYLREALKAVSSNIETGSSLSNALEKHPKIFSELYINMIRAGEISGTLDSMLERLADFGEKEFDTISKIKSASRYPLIAFIAICVAFGLIVTLVIPKFARVYDQFKTTLPLPTRLLIGLSILIKRYWFFGLIGLVVAIEVFRRYIKTKEGRLAWDSFLLRVPIIGQLMMMLIMSRFSRVTAVLLASGIPILQVLDVVSRTVDNAVISQTIDRIYESVKDGKGLAEPIGLSGVFPPIVVQMIAIGEETGKIDELLLRVAEYYDRESDYLIKNLTVMIEPVFILFLGIMVLTMALAVFLPMWNLASLFSH